jgi:hypothetical protein
LTPTPFREAAAAIGRRLERGALWQGGTCTWETIVPDPQADGTARGKAAAAGADLYGGTAGIALFLGELHGQTGDAAVLATARGALAHAVALAGSQPPAACGFHLGRVGIAYAACRLAASLRRPELAAEAPPLLEPLLAEPVLALPDARLDVISGAAGAIPALLEMAPSLGAFPALRLASKLGDELVALAHREPQGWSWNSRLPTRSRNLCGLAHGASGFALALLELAAATARGDYRFAAEMAFLYERRLFDTAADAWPDLRRPELEHWILAGNVNRLAAAARDGALPPARPAFFNAWCHGACGIGLARLRACELTGNEIFRREAETALRAARRDLAPRRDFSLCHGRGGFCELFLYAAEVLGDAGLAELAREVMTEGCRRYEAAGRAWPSGNFGGAYDPGLMLGEAGIGLLLLRLADPGIRPVVALRPSVPSGGEVDDAGAGSTSSADARLARAAMADYFSATTDAWTRLGEPVADLLSGFDPACPLAEAPAEFAYRVLARHCEDHPGARGGLLEDAFRAERGRFEATVARADWSVASLRAMARQDAAPEASSEPLRLGEGTRVIASEHDWKAWVAAAPAPGAGPPPARRTYQVLFAAQNSFHLRPVGRLAALLLELAARPSTLAELTRRVEEALGTKGQPQAVRDAVAGQVRELLACGWLEPAAPLSAQPRAAPARPPSGSEPRSPRWP